MNKAPPLPALNKCLNLFQESVPKQISKFAAQTGQLDELEELLQEQISKSEPVSDWEEFANPLLTRSERANPVARARPPDSEPYKPPSRGNPLGLKQFRENLAKVMCVDLKSLERKH